MRNQSRGFTLIEAMIALVVLAVATLGALSALTGALQQIRLGQNRQFKAMLAEARTQSYMLADKALVKGAAQAYPGSPPASLAIGAAPWQLDPSTPSAANPLATGALFKVDANGLVTQLPTGSITTCADASIADGTFCREMLVTNGLPTGGTPATGTAFTIWTRVSRKGEPLNTAFLHREVIVQ